MTADRSRGYVLSIAGTLIGQINGAMIGFNGGVSAGIAVLDRTCPDGCDGFEGLALVVPAILGVLVGFAIGGPLGLYVALRARRQPCAGLTAWLVVSLQVGTVAAVTTVLAGGRVDDKLEYLWLLVPMLTLPLPLAARWAVTRGRPPGPVRVAPGR